MKLVSREEQADQEHVRFSSDAAFPMKRKEGRVRASLTSIAPNISEIETKSCILRHFAVFPIKRKYF